MKTQDRPGLSPLVHIELTRRLGEAASSLSDTYIDGKMDYLREDAHALMGHAVTAIEHARGLLRTVAMLQRRAEAKEGKFVRHLKELSPSEQDARDATARNLLAAGYAGPLR